MGRHFGGADVQAARRQRTVGIEEHDVTADAFLQPAVPCLGQA